MVETEVKVVDYATMTEDQLKDAMRSAFDSGDWGAVKKIASAIDALGKKEEKAKKDALDLILQETTRAVKGLLTTIVDLMVAGQAPTNEQLNSVRAELKKLSGTELDGAEGVWFVYDFGAKREVGINPACRLMKGSRKSSGTGESSGKSSYKAGLPSSADMLKEVGDNVYIAEETKATIDKQVVTLQAGLTYQQAYDFSTNGGWRNKVRMALGKATNRI